MEGSVNPRLIPPAVFAREILNNGAPLNITNGSHAYRLRCLLDCARAETPVRLFGGTWQMPLNREGP